MISSRVLKERFVRFSSCPQVCLMIITIRTSNQSNKFPAIRRVPSVYEDIGQSEITYTYQWDSLVGPPGTVFGFWQLKETTSLMIFVIFVV